MCSLLGPMATEPAMVATQVEQVRALQEEVTSHADRFDQCLQSGMALLDRCDPQTSDAHGLNKQVEQVSNRSGCYDGLLSHVSFFFTADEELGEDPEEVARP